MSKEAGRSIPVSAALPELEGVDPVEQAARHIARQVDELEMFPEDPRATRDRAELERWQAVAVAPWVRPETIVEAVTRARAQRTIWLLEAVDLMAFGTGEPPQNHLEAGARRLQACRALCAAAADGAFSLVGILGEASGRPETISPDNFASDYRVGRGDNVLERDGSHVFKDDNAKFDRLDRSKWFEVRIGEKKQFLTWLSEPGAKPATIGPAPSKDEKRLYGAVDGTLLDEMESKLVNLEVASIQSAAASVAERAIGGGTLESKARRLARAYKRSGRKPAP